MSACSMMILLWRSTMLHSTSDNKINWVRVPFPWLLLVIKLTWSKTSWCLETTGPRNKDLITLRSSIWSPMATPMRCLAWGNKAHSDYLIIYSSLPPPCIYLLVLNMFPQNVSSSKPHVSLCKWTFHLLMAFLQPTDRQPTCTFIHRWQKLPCKVPTCSSTVIWGSVSFSRMHWCAAWGAGDSNHAPKPLLPTTCHVWGTFCSYTNLFSTFKVVYRITFY